ncbi:MAG: DUF2927 domain-containing protein [Litoreibacter sp.]|nr:DUF2927 domain-containing protein [Litoreibacter sp.]
MFRPARLILPLFLLGTALALSACGVQAPETASRSATALPELPPIKRFKASAAQPAYRSNAEIARDFLDLSFEMESGVELPFLTRFVGPITVSVNGTPSALLERDLNDLIKRLRAEAKIDISRAKPGARAQINIDAIPIKRLQRSIPQAACFVVPNVESFDEYRARRSGAQTDWTRLAKREQVTVVLPSDMPPQEQRDCLHEEIAQALGPLNDLYRLPDSIFNDDNFHNVLTGFDMLILRAYYAPEMRNGTTREEAARLLPGLLKRLNPSGGSNLSGPLSVTPRSWNVLISQALAPRISQTDRTKFARQALDIAKSRGWQDNRLALSYFVNGRVNLNTQPAMAVENILKANTLYRQLFGTALHAAHMATQIAAFAISTGQNETAIAVTTEALPAAREGENAVVLATLLLLQAQALENMGRIDAARAVRLDALGWGRYGFGSEKNIRARVADIRALSPKQAKGAGG